MPARWCSSSRGRRVDPGDRLHLVAVRAGSGRASSAGAGELDRGAREPPGRTRCLSRCGGVREMGGQGAADRSGVGVRRPRRAGWRGLRLGRRTLPGGPAYGQYLAGRVSVAEPPQRRVRADVSGGCVSAERIRTVRHDRQRLGVDHRLVPPSPYRRTAESLLHSAQPSWRLRRCELRPRAARRSRFRARC